MALYTRKGDFGTTKVLDSKGRFSKSSEHAEALGALDELNSFLGLCKVKAGESDELVILVGKKRIAIATILHEVQENLFIVQAEVAGAKDKKIAKTKITHMERVIDAIEQELPPIKGFTIAGGSELSVLLDVARTTARRTERRAVALHESGVRKLSKHSLAYLNRLSSLLFALARLVNGKSGITEAGPRYGKRYGKS